MPIFEVELEDGRILDIESDIEPDSNMVLRALNAYQPAPESQSAQATIPDLPFSEDSISLQPKFGAEAPAYSRLMAPPERVQVPEVSIPQRAEPVDEGSDWLGIGDEVRGIGRAAVRGVGRFEQEEAIRRMRMAEMARRGLETGGYERYGREMAAAEESGRRASADYALNQRTLEGIAQTEAQKEFFKPETPWWDFFKNPVELSMTTMMESAPTMVGTMAAAPGGPVAMGAAAGVGSFGAESSARITRAMQESGVDLEDADSVWSWFEDRARSDPAIAKAELAAIGPAFFDSLSAGVAGQLLKRAMGKGALRVGAAALGESGIQATSGAAGSVAGSMLAGEPVDPKDVTLEFFSEMAPVEAGSSLLADRARRSQAVKDAKLELVTEAQPRTQEETTEVQLDRVNSRIAELESDPTVTGRRLVSMDAQGNPVYEEGIVNARKKAELTQLKQRRDQIVSDQKAEEEYQRLEREGIEMDFSHEAQKFGYTGKVEFMDESQMGEDDQTLKSNIAVYNRTKRAIQVNRQAWMQANPEQRQKELKSLASEEVIHSHVSDNEARKFARNATWLQRVLGGSIYKAGTDITNLDEVNLGHEMIRRTIQWLNGVEATELTMLHGKDRRIAQVLDFIDRIIDKIRGAFGGTAARQAQLEIINNVKSKIERARRSIEFGSTEIPISEGLPGAELTGGGISVASPRREPPQTADDLLRHPLGTHSPEQIAAMPDEAWDEAMARPKGEKWSVTADATAWAMNQQPSPELIKSLEDAARRDMEQAVAKGTFPQKMQWYLDAAHVLKGDEVGQGNVATVRGMEQQGRVSLAKPASPKRSKKMQEFHSDVEQFKDKLAPLIVNNVGVPIDTRGTVEILDQVVNISRGSGDVSIHPTMAAALRHLFSTDPEFNELYSKLKSQIDGFTDDEFQAYYDSLSDADFGGGEQQSFPAAPRRSRSEDDSTPDFGYANDLFKEAQRKIFGAPDAIKAYKEFGYQRAKIDDELRKASRELWGRGEDFLGAMDPNSKEADAQYAKVMDLTKALRALGDEYWAAWGEERADQQAFPAAPRRGMSKKEERRIEELRKYREATGQQPVTPQGPASGSVSRREAPASSRKSASEFFEKPTPEKIEAIATTVLDDPTQLPSFERFMNHVRAAHGDITSGQVSETWAGSVWKFLNAATGAQLESLVDRLGLRRQVFGSIRQGSKALGLAGAPQPIARQGTIADASPSDIAQTSVAKAQARSAKLLERASLMETKARDKARTKEEAAILNQRAQILRRTAENLSSAAAAGEGMPMTQEDLLPGITVHTSQLTGQPVPVPGKPGATKFVGKAPTVPEIAPKGAQVNARTRAIRSIGELLLSERTSLTFGLNRREIGVEDVRWNEEGNELYVVTDRDLSSLEDLGYEMTRGAATDASTKRIAGGGQFVVQEKALPRSATKRVVALLDPATGRVHLVSGYRDGRRGPVFLDPSSATSEHRTLEQLKRYRPVVSIPLDSPVQNFHQVFESEREFNDKLYNPIKKIADQVGWRGMGQEQIPIEGTEGLEGQGGIYMGPEAGIQRSTEGMVDGVLGITGAEITGAEARQLFKVFRTFESRQDVDTYMAGLRQKVGGSRQNRQLNARISALTQSIDRMREERGGQIGRKEQRLNEKIARLEEQRAKLEAKKVPELTNQDWLFLTGLTKVERSLHELYRPIEGVAGGRKVRRPTPEEISEETINELYGIAKRNETGRSFTASTQRQFAPRSAPTTPLREAEAPSPTARELSMLSRRPPTDVSRAEPGQPQVPTGAEGGPAGLRAEVEPRGRRRAPAQEPTRYGEIIPQPLQGIPKSQMRRGRVLDYTGQKRPAGRALVETGGRVAEPTSYPATGEVGTPQAPIGLERGETVRYEPRTREQIASEVQQISESLPDPATPAEPTIQQQELPGTSPAAPRRLTDDQNRIVKNYFDAANEVASRTSYGQRDVQVGPGSYGAVWYDSSNRWDATRALAKGTQRLDANQIIIRARSKREADLIASKLPPLPLSAFAAERNPLFGKATDPSQKAREILEFYGQEPVNPDVTQYVSDFMDSIRSPEQINPAAPRRRRGRTLGEQMSNVLTDFGSIYDRWMADRLEHHGGPVTRGAVRIFRGMIDRQKELYGQMTPTLDRARRLAGGVETSRGANILQKVKDLPRKATESAKAHAAAVWGSKVNRVTPGTGTARIVDAVEGRIPVPAYAQNYVDAISDENLEIGRMVMPVTPGFVAGGKWQRNLTGVGYDIMRAGSGELWKRWTHGMAVANRTPNVPLTTTLRDVRQDFTKFKKILDDPASTADQVESINQDMARNYPNVITHVKSLGRWIEVIHSNPFNYLERTAQRSTHVRAFREIFPNDAKGRADFAALIEQIREELPGAEFQRDLDGLMRSLNGHPTDQYDSNWMDLLRLNPEQAGGQALRMMNQSLNNLLSRMVLTGQMAVQPAELFLGTTPQTVGWKHWARAMAKAKRMYPELEFMGSVNRVMYDWTFNRNQPGRSTSRILGNIVSKAFLTNWMNEAQEAVAATAAQLVTEDIMSGRLSYFDKVNLPLAFRDMGFSRNEARQMLAGDQTLLNQFRRMAAARWTAGNKALSEGSRISASSVFNSVFRFMSYPMMKMNQARGVLSRFAEAWFDGGTKEERIGATARLASWLVGNTLQGAGTVMLTSLAFGGISGLKIRAKEAEDEPGKFLMESFLSAMSGPFYILWRGARMTGGAGIGEQAARAAFPYAVMNDLSDLRDGVGPYRNKNTWDKIGTFVKQKTPGLKMVKTGFAMFGLANESREFEAAINAFYRWRRTEMGFKEERRYLKDDERAEFRRHVHNAIDAMKEGDTERYIEEWLLAVDAQDADAFRQSMNRRKVLVDPDGAPLSEELKDKLINRIGMEAYERLESYDAMLEAASLGLVPER